jgi:hypothetical protein
LPEKAEGFTIRPYPQDSGALHMSIFEQPSIVYSVLWEEVILATDGKINSKYFFLKETKRQPLL